MYGTMVSRVTESTYSVDTDKDFLDVCQLLQEPSAIPVDLFLIRFLLLDSLSDEVVMKVDIVPLDSAIQSLDDSPSSLVFTVIGTPIRSFRNVQIDPEHDADHCPFEIDGGEIIVGRIVVHDLERERRAQLTEPIPFVSVERMLTYQNE